MNLSLKGKTALVTGSGSGIGKGIFDVLCEAGATVIGCGRRTLNQDCLPGDSEYYQCDVTSISDLTKLTASIKGKHGKLDILVSNAGTNFFYNAEECSEEKWSNNIELNLSSHWRISKLAAPLLRRGDYPVIQIMSSNHAYRSIRGCFPYNVAKTALLGLVRSMALDLAPDIRVIGLAPGFIETDISKKWFGSFENPESEKKRTIDIHPLKRLGTPRQIGGFSVFLSSPYAAFMTGETLVMDGGRCAVLQEI